MIAPERRSCKALLPQVGRASRTDTDRTVLSAGACSACCMLYAVCSCGPVGWLVLGLASVGAGVGLKKRPLVCVESWHWASCFVVVCLPAVGAGVGVGTLEGRPSVTSSSSRQARPSTDQGGNPRFRIASGGGDFKVSFAAPPPLATLWAPLSSLCVTAPVHDLRLITYVVMCTARIA